MAKATFFLTPLFVLFLFVFSIYSQGEESSYETKSANVLILKDHSFPLHVTSNKFQWLIEFVDQNCPTCIRLRYKFEESADRLQEDEEVKGRLKFGRVLCNVDRDLCKKLKVDAYPTILFYRSGKFYEYIGSYEAHKLKEFTTEKWKEKISSEIGDAEELFQTDKEGASDSDSDVVVLNEVNFLEKISSGDAWFVKFYAPWCGHCKRLEPIWEQFATSQKGKIKVAKVDCTIEPELAKRFGIRGFPSLKLIQDGWVYDYKGSRTEEDLTEFATSKYAEATSAPLPYTSPSFITYFTALAKQFEDWAVGHPTEAFVAIAVVFLFIGMLLGKLTSSKKVITVTITKSTSTLPSAPEQKGKEKEKQKEKEKEEKEEKAKEKKKKK